MKTVFPSGYYPKLSIRETQEAIKYIRDTFQKEFAKHLNLYRISAPLFVPRGSGLNDDLNGIEEPVSFHVAWENDRFEIVHSLAKWKRIALKEYGFHAGEGLYTNMNAVRKEEELDNLHSIYVDQWDWEKVITEEQRNAEYLEETVRKIFRVIKHMQHETEYRFPKSAFLLPEKISFVDSNDLYHAYPHLSAKERENRICKDLGCVFLFRIGDKIDNGMPHDGRAPDYDDWQLNGDILFWYEPLNCAIEISSMGIRVNRESLLYQLEKSGCPERANLPYHKALLNDELPLTIGGGIGQSRLCMLLLGKAHIGEVQASIWPEEMRAECRRNNIPLL